jgi:hypothetical protein
VTERASRLQLAVWRSLKNQEKKVHVFEDMTNASVLSEKKLPLEKTPLIISYNFRLEASKDNFLEALVDFFCHYNITILMGILPIEKPPHEGKK